MLPSGVASAESNAARGIVRAGTLRRLSSRRAIRGCVHGEDWRADLFWTAASEEAPVAALGGGSLESGAAALELPGEIARETSPPAWPRALITATGLIIAQCFYGDDLATLGISIVSS